MLPDMSVVGNWQLYGTLRHLSILTEFSNRGTHNHQFEVTALSRGLLSVLIALHNNSDTVLP